MRPRDLETLEFPRVLDAIAALARSPAGRDAVLALRPTADADEAANRLEALAEVVAQAAVAGPPPTGDVPILAAAVADAAPEGAALELRRLVEVRDLLAAGRGVRAWLRRDPESRPDARGDRRRHARGPRRSRRPSPTRSTRAGRSATRPARGSPLRAPPPATFALRSRRGCCVWSAIPISRTSVTEQYVTLRNGRFVIPVRASAPNAIAGVVQDRSGSDETLFVEPLFAVDLNNRLLLACKTEEAEERRVRIELTTLVRLATPEHLELERTLARIDALGAAAAFASQHACTRPAARHRRRRRCPRRAIRCSSPPAAASSRSISASARTSGASVLTGPNAGGKTVALKTLGLCALMAQTGLFVPAAEGAHLPLFDAVLADVGDEQSIERDLSTFTAHVGQPRRDRDDGDGRRAGAARRARRRHRPDRGRGARRRRARPTSAPADRASSSPPTTPR